MFMVVVDDFAKYQMYDYFFMILLDTKHAPKLFLCNL